MVAGNDMMKYLSELWGTNGERMLAVMILTSSHGQSTTFYNIIVFFASILFKISSFARDGEAFPALSSALNDKGSNERGEHSKARTNVKCDMETTQFSEKRCDGGWSRVKVLDVVSGTRCGEASQNRQAK